MSLLKHGASLSVSQLIEKVLSFGIVLLASRILKTEGIGEFFYYFSLVSLFIPLIDLGLQKLLLQRWFRCEEEDRHVLMTRLFVLKLVGGGVGLILALGTDALVRWGHANPPAIFACFIAIFSVNLGDLFRRPRFAEQRIELDVGIPVFTRLLTFVGVLVLLHHFVHGYQLAYIYAIANILGMLISLAGIKGYWPVRWRSLQRRPLVQLLKEGVPFSLTSLFVMLSLYIDSVMLGHFSLEEVGAYGAAYRVILVAAGLSGGTAAALFPRIVQMNAQKNQAQIGRTLTLVLRIHLMLFGMLAVGGIFMGERMMVGLYGDAFTSSGLPFRILSGLILLVSFTNVIGHVLEAMELQKQVLKVACRAALFNFVANLLLIPVWGMIGAAITTVLTESIVLIYHLRLLRTLPELKIARKPLQRGLIFLIPVAVLFALLPSFAGWLERTLPWPSFGTWIALVCGGLIAILYFLMRKTYWLDGLLIESKEQEGGA